MKLRTRFTLSAAIVIACAAVLTALLWKDIPEQIAPVATTQEAPQANKAQPVVAAQPEARTQQAPEAEPAVVERKIPPASTFAPPAVRAFHDWASQYLLAEPQQRPMLIKQGKELAQQHRKAIGEMIPQSPKLALENAVPMVVRQDLPQEIVEQLEKRVNERGAYEVKGVLPQINGVEIPAVNQPILHTFTAKGAAVGQSRRVYSYGSRSRDLSLPDTRINGIEVDGVIAMADSRVRRLEVGERPDPNKPAVEVCPVSGETTTVERRPGKPLPAVASTQVAIEDEAQVIYLCAGGHISAYSNSLASEEADARNPVMAEGGAGGGSKPYNPPAGFGTGVRDVLYMRVAFPDIGQEPRSEAEAYDVMRQVTDFYLTSSYGQFYLVPTVTPLIVAPYPESWYLGSVNGNNEPNGYAILLGHAREVARRMGYDTNQYDLEVMDYRAGPHTTETGINFAGLGSVGGKGVWLYSLNANSVVGVLAHEMGHNLGLSHSNFWQSNPASFTGPGQNVEYGNHFDVMGGATSMGHYVAPHKYYINWLNNNNVHDVKANGTYRLYQVDQGKSDADKRYALHVNRDSERDYWLEFRQNHPTIPSFMSGLMVTWSPWGNYVSTGATNGSSGGAQLVDMTPNSGGIADSRNDAGLPIGKTYTDPDANLFITPIAKSTTTPPYVDVVVNRGPFPGNQAPALILTASALQISGTSTPCTLTAKATDPEGDPVAYSWDFGDGTFATNNASKQVKTWAAAGKYFVTCTASDMKGGKTTRSLLIGVGFSSNQYVISGQVRDSMGNGVEGIYMANRALVADVNQSTAPLVPANFRSAYTDSNGNYALTNLADGANITITANSYPMDIAPTAVTTYASLQSDQSGIDFIASGPQNVINVQVVNGTATENGPNAVITISRPALATGILNMQIMDGSSGTAVRDTDYTLVATPALAGTGLDALNPGPVLVNNSPVGTSRLRFEDRSDAPPVITLTLTVTALTDGLNEGLEEIVIELPDTAGGLPINGPRTIRIPIIDEQSNLPVVKVVAEDPLATEAGHAATFHVERNGPTVAPLTVKLDYDPGTNGVQFNAPATVVIPAGAASATFTAAPIEDLTAEGTLVYTAYITPDPAYIIYDDVFEFYNYLSFTGSYAEFSIIDNDQPVVSVVASVPSVSEGSTSPGKFTISRTATDISQPLTVVFSLGGSALSGQDFRRIEGTATIPAYELSAVINIDPINDTVSELTQTVICRLSSNDAYAVSNPGVATVSITDNDSSEFVVEATGGSGNGAVQEPLSNQQTVDLFTISRPTGGTAVTVNFTTSGTATAGFTPGSDYSPLPGFIFFGVNDLSRTVQVSLNPDVVKESAESISLSLAPGSGYRLGFETSATSWIMDNGAPTVDVSVADQTSSMSGVSEGSSQTRFWFARTGPTTNALTVKFDLNPGIVPATKGYAEIGSDFNINTTASQSPTTLTIPANKVGAFLTVSLINDVVAEGAEKIVVSVNDDAAYSRRTATATQYINDNDAFSGPTAVLVGFEATTSTVNERNGNSASVLTIPVSLDRVLAISETVDVDYYISNASATGNGVDYTLTPDAAGTLHFVEGDQTLYLTLTTTPDGVPEGDETVQIRLNHVTSANVGQSTHTVTITDYALPDVFTSPLNKLPTVSAELRGRVFPNVSGKLGSIIVSDGGTGYTSTPTVAISGGGGTGATATAVVTANVVTGITVNNGGVGYISAPTITITGGGGTGATAVGLVVPIKTLDGVGTVVVSKGGTGYVDAPVVGITGGSGLGAVGTAVVSPAGVITGITVTNPGTGYLTAPTVNITAASGSGATATATVNAGVITGFVVTSGGTGYPAPIVVAFTGGAGTGATAQATVTAGAISGITVLDPGKNYTSAPTVTITGGGGTGAEAACSLAGTLTWFQWGTTPSFNKPTTTRRNAGLGDNQVNFAANVDVLPALLTYPGTYYYRAVAQNGFGTASGITRTIRTVAPPSVTTLKDIAHTSSTITLAGTLMSNRLNGETWFEWGTSIAYGNSTPHKQVLGSASAQSVSSTLTGLTEGALIHYRCVLQTPLGIAYGGDMEASVVSQAVAGVLLVNINAKQPTAGTATWINQGTLDDFTQTGTGGVVNSVLGTGIPGVYFNGVTDYYTGPPTTPEIDGNSNRTIELWVMNPGFGGSDDIVSLGRDGTRTLNSVRHNPGTSGAVGHGGADDMGYAANTLPSLGQWHHLVYTYDGAKHAKVYVDGALKVSKTTAGDLATTVGDTINLGTARDGTGALLGSTFHGYINSVRIHAGELTAAQVLSNYGVGPTVADPTTPLAQTKGALNIAATTATLQGLVVPRGAATTAWIEWGVSNSYDNATAPVNAGAAWAPFTVSVPLSGLVVGVEYHFRVAAENSFGVSYGNDVVFTPGTIANSGILWVDLRADDPTAGSAAWHNRGALGDFAIVGSPLPIANTLSTGVAGVQFDGLADGYQSLVNADPDIAFGSDLTVEAWVLNPALNGTSEAATHLGRRNGLRSALQQSAGSVDAWRNNTETGTWATATPAGAPSAGTWHHLVLVQSTSTLDTYVDGKLVLSTPLVNGPNTADDPVLLGAARDVAGALIWGGDGFSGYVNNIRIHGGRLTAAQVQTNFNAGPSGVNSSGPGGVAPVVMTQPATLISNTSATLHGDVTPGGLTTSAWAEWGTSIAYGNVSPTVPLANAFATQSMNFPIGGLTAGQTYHFRVVAQNAQGTVQGLDQSFVANGSPANLPGATTSAATAVAAGKATLNGTATPGGLAAQAWFEYGPSPAMGSSTAKVSITAATASKVMTVPVTGLLPHSTYSFRLVVENATGQVAGAVLTFNTPNSAPVASAGKLTVKENTPTPLPLKGTDADKEALTYIITTPPANGIISGSSPNFIYTSSGSFTTDSLQFKVSDGVAESAPVTFTITITPVNDAPVAQNDLNAINEDVVHNDTMVGTDEEGDPITAWTVVAQPQYGTLTTGAAGAYTYTPDAHYAGPDSFQFVVTAGGQISAPGTVSFTMAQVLEAPIAENSNVWNDLDAVVAEQAIGYDPDGSAVTFTKLSDPLNGIATMDPDGAWTYTPTLAYVGVDSFTFKVNDGTSDSNIATITVTTGVATVEDQEFTGVRDDLLTGLLVASGPNSANATFSVVDQPEHGTMVLETDGSFRYNPVANFVGTDSFTFRAHNGTAFSNTATAYLTITQRPPNWVWVGGPSVAKKAGVYGTKGVAALPNLPGARSDYATWLDANGDFWLFGGSGIGTAAAPGLLNDLWKRDATTGLWAWMGGANVTGAGGSYGVQAQASASNWPGARSGSIGWTGQDGSLWLFGGTGRDSSAAGSGVLNDLWRYDTGSGEWTWLKGSNFINANGTYGAKGIAAGPNTPGGRAGAAAWADAAGRFWLFGGNGRPVSGIVSGNLNDLWCYDPGINKWVWINGVSTIDPNSVAGLVGAGSSSFTPSGRSYAEGWVGTNGVFYLFGGTGKGATGPAKGNLNDLWSFDPTTYAWTWLTGSSAVNGAAVWGTLGVPAAANTPGARSGTAAITDGTSNTLLFGGQGAGALNDLWRYNEVTHQWTWLKGPQTANGAAAYGTLGVPASSNTPGARRGAGFIQDGSSNTILFGGVNGANTFSDVWKLDTTEAAYVVTLPATSILDDEAELSLRSVAGDTPADIGIDYWPKGDPGARVSIPLGQVFGDGTSNTIVLGLVPGTTYVCQATASNPAGDSFGLPIEFTTTGAAPALSVDFASPTYTNNEADGYGYATVILSGPAPGAFTVPLNFTGGTAEVGTDYLTSPAVVSFAAGQTQAVVAIPLVNDKVIESAGETITLSLDTPSAFAGLGAVTNTEISVDDDDALPGFGSHPLSQFKAVGESTTFSVTVTGTVTTYQWKKNNANIVGATSDTLTLTAAIAAAGNYTCEITGPTGKATSNVGELFVVDATTPLSLVKPVGGTGSFTVTAAGPPGLSLSYAWKLMPSGSLLSDLLVPTPRRSGTATKTINFLDMRVSDTSQYACEVSKTLLPTLKHDSATHSVSVPDLAPIVEPQTPPNGVVGVPYSYKMVVNTSVSLAQALRRAPMTYSATGLPGGLAINATTGVISGKPTTAVAGAAVTLTASVVFNSNTLTSSQPTTMTITTLPTGGVGSYAGLINRLDNLANPDAGGRFEIAVTSVGGYTAKVFLPGVTGTTSFTSAVTPVFTGANVTALDGVATFKLTGGVLGTTRISSPAVMNFSLNPTTGAATGTFVEAGRTFTLVGGTRNPWSASSPTPAAGDYTALLDIPTALTGDLEIPQGSSYGTFKVAPDGKLTFAGKTADGLAFTVGSFSGLAGQIPAISTFTTTSILWGTLAIDGGGYLSGAVDWRKAPALATSKDMAYRAGFDWITLSGAGGKYTLPAAGSVIMGLPNSDNNAQLKFYEAGLVAGELGPLTFSIRNNSATTTQTVTVLPNPAKITCALAAPAGTFSGGFIVPNSVATLARKGTFQGVISKTSAVVHRAGGFFLLPQLPQPGQTLTTSPVLSGKVTLAAPAP